MTEENLKFYTLDKENTCLQFSVPKASDWQCRVANITYRPVAGKEPNRFHRFMQGLILGLKWEKVSK